MIRFRAILAAAAFAAALPATAADNVRLVLQGYDPVAYFTQNKPVKGDPKYVYEWDEGRYHFASARHRDMFAGDPEKYAPQFGGYCTGSMSRGVRNEGDPESWAIHDGRLYVVGAKARKDIKDPEYLTSRIPKAQGNWKAVKVGS